MGLEVEINRVSLFYSCVHDENVIFALKEWRA